MADILPLKQYPVETTRPIQPGVSPADVAQPYKELASTMEKFGDAAETVASSMAEQAGSQAVTKDANGNVQVEKALFVGPAAAHWERARKMAALAEADGAAQREDIKLRADFRDNPDGYLKAADQFARDAQADWTKKAGPEVGLGVRRVVERTTTQTYRGLQNEFERLSLQNSEAAMQAGVKSATDDLTALARGGKTDPNDPDVKAAWDKFDTLQKARASNPRLAYPPEQAAFEREHLLGQLGANAFLYHVDKEYKAAPTKAEGAQRAIEYAQGILTNKDLKLTQNEREAYYHKAVGEIRANEAIRKQDIGEARLASQSLLMANSLGVPITPDEADGVIKMHEAAGDQAGAARLQAALIRKGLSGDEFNKLPTAERARQLSALQGQAAAKSAYDFFTGRGYTPAQAAGIVGNLIHESGLDPGAVGDAGTSVGLAQFHNERAVALAQFAREKGTKPGDFQTQLEFIDKELRSTEGRAFQALQAATTPEDAAAAFIHYERPKGYDPANLTASMGFGSRVAQAKAVFGGQGAVDTGTAAGSAWLSMSRGVALNKDAWTQWKQIKEDYAKEKIRPPDRVIEALRQSAYATGDSALLEDIAKKGDMISATEDFAQNQTSPGQAATITEMHRMGAERGLDPGQQALLKDFEQRHEAIDKGLKDNPISTTVANFGNRFQTPAPLNVQDPQQLAAGLAYRGRVAQFAAQNWQVGPVSALDKADLEAVSAALKNPDPAVKAGVLQAITAALPEDVRAATLEKLGEKGHDQLVAVMAGGMMKDANETAVSILQGQKAIAADKGYLPEGPEKVAYTENIAKLLPASMFTEASRSSPTGSMVAFRGATQAMYAFLSMKAGDESGKFVPERLTAAADAVTGGILTHNGSKFIAPARGMPQARWDSLLYGINETDLAGVTSPAGEPITPAFLRGRAKLESVGNGRYGVLLGSDPNKPIYAITGANTEMPQKFVLDMRGRTNVGVPPEGSGFPAVGVQ